jgi:hypothetical protein
MVRFRFWRPLYHLSARSGAALIKARLWPLRASITGRALLLARGIFTVSVLLSGLSPSLSLSLSLGLAHILYLSLSFFLARARSLARSLSHALLLSRSLQGFMARICVHMWSWAYGVYLVSKCTSTPTSTNKHTYTHTHTHTYTDIYWHPYTHTRALTCIQIHARHHRIISPPIQYIPSSHSKDFVFWVLFFFYFTRDLPQRVPPCNDLKFLFFQSNHNEDFF